MQKRGISLIVLVITIIVMIILATAIIISLNNTGIIENSNKAVSDTDYKNVSVAAQLKYSDILLGENTNGVQKSEYIREKLIENGTITYEQAKLYKFKNDGDVVRLQTKAEYEQMYKEELGILDESYYTVTNGKFKLTEAGKTAATTGSLTKLAIPYGVTAIDNYAASGCKKLTHVIMPDTVTEIDYQCFYNCTNLENIVISKNIFIASKYSFQETKWYKNEIAKAEGENYYIILGNVLLEALNKSENVVIPDEVEVIGERAFEPATAIKKIYISENVKNIEGYAFANCDNVNNITFEAELPELADGAFYNQCGCVDYGGVGTCPEISELPIDETTKNKILEKNKMALTTVEFE